MQTKHIKSVALVTDTAKMWSYFEFPEPDRWIVAFEVSEAFAREFIIHMRKVAEQIFETGLGEFDGVSQEEIEALGVFHYEDAQWLLSIDGTTIIRSCEYDDMFAREVPDDWWMDCIAIMKEVLKKTA